MANERARVAMTPAEIADFVSGRHTAVLVTLGSDGFPEPVGMWYAVDSADGSLWMRTYARSQKVLNLRRDPRAAILIEEGDSYATLRGVQLVGHVELSDDADRICDVVADLMVRYEGLDPEHAPAVREAYRPRAAKQRALRLVVERTASWDHSKLSGTP